MSCCSVDPKRKMKEEIQRNLYLNPPTEMQEFAGKTTQQLNTSNIGQGAN